MTAVSAVGIAGCGAHSGSRASECAPIGSSTSCPPWHIIASPDGERAPDVGSTSVQFGTADGGAEIVVRAPCNTLSAPYSVHARRLEIVDAFSSTLAACGEPSAGQEAAARRFFEKTLDLRLEDGDLVLGSDGSALTFTQS